MTNGNLTWHIIFSASFVSFIFGMGVLYNKFKVLQKKVAMIATFEERCARDRTTNEHILEKTLARIEEQLQNIQTNYKELREELREFVKDARKEFAPKQIS